MGKLIKIGSGFSVKKVDSGSVGLRKGQWYLIDVPNKERIFNYAFVLEEESLYNRETIMIVYCHELYTRTGLEKVHGYPVHMNEEELENLKPTEMRNLMDIMFYKTNNLKDGA